MRRKTFDGKWSRRTGRFLIVVGLIKLGFRCNRSVALFFLAHHAGLPLLGVRKRVIYIAFELNRSWTEARLLVGLRPGLLHRPRDLFGHDMRHALGKCAT